MSDTPDLCVNCGSTLVLVDEKFIEYDGQFEIDETFTCYCGATVRFRVIAPNIHAAGPCE